MSQTLDQLYAEIDTNVDTLNRVISESDPNNRWVRLTIDYKTATGGAQSINRFIWIKGKGLPSEEAYWDGSKPEYLTTADAFASALPNKISLFKSADPTYEISYVVDQHNTEMWARVDFYKYDSVSGKSSLRHFVVQKVGTAWNWREIV